MPFAAVREAISASQQLPSSVFVPSAVSRAARASASDRVNLSTHLQRFFQYSIEELRAQKLDSTWFALIPCEQLNYMLCDLHHDEFLVHI